MTRSELIKAIFENGDSWSCPEGEICEKSTSCEACAEKQIAEYEKQIRAKALDDFVKKCEKAALYQFGQKYVDIRAIREIAEQLKERANV